MAPFSLLSLTFSFKYIVARNFSHHMNVLFQILRHARPKEGIKQTLSLLSLPRKNITYYKLASFVSDFPVFFKVSSIFLLYFHK